jgi:hypothetical protein
VHSSTPAAHRFVSRSQRGSLADVQSKLDAHSTHSPSTQAGVAPPHAASV